jgi:hypothetical protein
MRDSDIRPDNAVLRNADKVIGQMVGDSERAVEPHRRGVRYVERGRRVRTLKFRPTQITSAGSDVAC